MQDDNKTQVKTRVCIWFSFELALKVQSRKILVYIAIFTKSQ